MAKTLISEITYRNMPASKWLDGEIQKRVNRLAAFCPEIVSCKVIVEIPHRHHEQGNHFHVRVDVAVPGETIVAGHAPNLHVGQGEVETKRERQRRSASRRKDAPLALREAFAAAKRQLRDYARRRRLAVKPHHNGRHAGGHRQDAVNP